MKIFSISDLHLSLTTNKPMDIFGYNWENYWEKITEDWNNKVSDDDIVLIAGDISWAMKLDDAICDLNEINKLKGKKIFVRGNHDYWWQSLSVLRSKLPQNMYVIQNDAIKIGNFVICGSRGWTVPETTHKTPEDEKLFNREMLRLELSLKFAQNLLTENDNLIVMIHYPPFNSQFNGGYTDLFEKYKVDTVVYGHIHGNNSRAEKHINKNGIDYYLTSCDQVDNTLVEIYDTEK